ncbi:hypothetical protein QJS66_01390 [Kocuria rhizophila]|nr:hypothetical protein QJS66_01390 [Kocuria rhizophila]
MLAKCSPSSATSRMLTPEPCGDGWTVADASAHRAEYFEATRHPSRRLGGGPDSVRRIDPGHGEAAPANAVVQRCRDQASWSAAASGREADGAGGRPAGRAGPPGACWAQADDAAAVPGGPLRDHASRSARRRAAPRPPRRSWPRRLPEVERFLDRGHPGFVASSGRVGLYGRRGGRGLGAGSRRAHRADMAGRAPVPVHRVPGRGTG